MLKNIKEKHVNLSIWFGVGLIFTGAIVFFWSGLTGNIEGNLDTERIARYGDFIGGVVGSLWALGGMFLVYLGLKDQREDIKLNKDALKAQIEEFKLQKLELEETRKVFEKQTKNLELQQFEVTFFNLITLINKQVEEISHSRERGLIAMETYSQLINHEELRKKGKKYFSAGNYHIQCVPVMNTFLITLNLIYTHNINLKYYLNILGASFTRNTINMIGIYASYTEFKETFSESPFYHYCGDAKMFLPKRMSPIVPTISTL